MSTTSIWLRIGAHVRSSLFCNLVKESRPLVLTLAIMRFAAGVLVPTGTEPSRGAGAAGLAWILVTAGIYLTNASSDVVADTVNHKQRPLARGLISRRQVNAGAAWAFAGAVVLGAVLGPAFLTILTSMAAMGIYYSIGPRPGKNHFLSTALIVAAGIFLPYAAGSLAAHGEIKETSIIVGILCGCWAAVASISKDFPDVAGDRVTGRTTLPVAVGLERAWKITAGSSAAVALLTLSCTLVFPGLQGLWVLSAGAAVFASSCIALLRRQNTPASLRTPYRIFMMIQIFTNVALIVLAPTLALATP